MKQEDYSIKYIDILDGVNLTDGDSGSLNLIAKFRDKGMEQYFFYTAHRRELDFIKWIVMASGLFNMIFLLHDYYYIPNQALFLSTLCLRLSYGVWAGVFFLLTVKLKNVWILSMLQLLTEVYFMFTQILILYLLKYDNFDSHSLLLLIIFFGYAVVSNNWLYYTISLLGYAVLYFWTTNLYLTGYSLKEYITAGIYFFFAILLCSLANYRNNRYRRAIFYEGCLRKHIVRIENEKNTLLEIEKQQTVELLEKEKIIARVNKLAFLRAQINPHFLYNTLNTIEAFCYSDSEVAGGLIMHLSNYLNYAFDFDAKEQVVSFDDELKLVHAYVAIEKVRFSDRFDIEYDLCNTAGLYLPALTIQPLIENAIRHGSGRKEDKDIITLRVSEEDTHYHISVTDTGIGMAKERLDTLLQAGKNDTGGIGIANIHSRLKELYGESLVISSEINQGTSVSFRIPKSAAHEVRQEEFK